MYCVIKCIVRGNQARVKNADLRHPSCTVVMQRRKSASPVHNVLIIPYNTVLLEKPTNSQLLKKFPTFYGTRSSLPHSQMPAICPYPKPAPSSPFTHIRLTENPSYYYPPIYPWVSQVVSFPQVSPTKPRAPLLSRIGATCPTHLIFSI